MDVFGEPRPFRISTCKPGVILVAANAIGASLMAGYLWQSARRPSCLVCPPPSPVPAGAWAIVSGAVAVAWLAVWAWARGLWILVAVCLLLSLAAPWGYFVEISGPIVLGLIVVSLVRAWRGRRAGREARDAPITSGKRRS